METIPPEIKLLELWNHLPYEDIVNLCQTNREFNLICQYNSTWQYLLYRDFGITYTEGNARNLYLLYKHALDYFSNFYPIITQRALYALVNVAPVSTWSNLEKAIRVRHQDLAGKILSVIELVILCEEVIENEFGEEVNIVNDIVDCYMFEKLGYSNNINPNLDEMFREIRDVREASSKGEYNKLYETRNKYAKVGIEFSQHKCDEFIKLISYPTLIFINKKPILINWDYDLARSIPYWFGSPGYNRCMEAIEKDILALANI